MTVSLTIGHLMRRPGPPEPTPGADPIRIRDRRLAAVLTPDARLLTLHRGTLHGEGTCWDAPRNRLVWSDVANRRLLAWHPEDGRVTVAIDANAFMNGNALDPAGRLLHCEHGRRCISRSDGDGVAEPIATHFEGRRLNSPNDVATAPDGATWFTDPSFGLLMPNQGCLAHPELDHRSVYRIDPASGEPRRMADFEQPNGLAFTADGRTLYVSDTARSMEEIPWAGHGSTHDILAFDVGPDGALSRRRPFWQAEHGVPDGFRVDARGWIWTTAGDGVHVLSAEGEPLGHIPTPDVAANLCFGGPDGRRLFIAATDRLLALDLLA